MIATNKLFAALGLSLLAAASAHAYEGEGSTHALEFNSTRDRAAVVAEAQTKASDTTNGRATYLVAPRVQSALERSTVRDMAAQALRTGAISSGELG